MALTDAPRMLVIASATTPCAATEPATGACLRQSGLPTQTRMPSHSFIAPDYARAMG